MTAQPVPPNAYTDAPELHPNLILGSLQLLFWLFIHPAAWRNHIARIDRTLSPDFCLAELNRVQWHNWTLRRLLLQGYFVLPLLSGLLIGLILWMMHQSSYSIIYGITRGVALDIGLGIAVGAVGGLSRAVAGGVVAGIAVGVVDGLASGSASSELQGGLRLIPLWSL